MIDPNPIKADKNRIVNKFMELTRIDSVSFHERKIADLLKAELQDLGFQVYEDDAAAAYSSDICEKAETPISSQENEGAEPPHGNNNCSDTGAGNIYAILKGDPARKPVLFSAHMDTVTPGIGKIPVLSDDGEKITSDGNTILGADDVSGIVEILEGVRLAGTYHGDIEVLFTMGEEVYAKGASVFDYSRLISKEAYVLDMSGTPGTAAHKAPSIISFKVTVKGRSAHAGFSPEDGINALKIAANAIARIKQGRISENTTFNIGTISAGKATNIVPELCICTGEARSFDHEEAMAQIKEAAAIFREEAAALSQSGSSEDSEIKAESPSQSDTAKDLPGGIAPVSQSKVVEDSRSGIVPVSQSKVVEDSRSGIVPVSQSKVVEESQSGIVPAGSGVEMEYTSHIRAYETPVDSAVCDCFKKACRDIGLESHISSTLGGSDNNVFMQHGLSGIVLSSGMYNTHTTEEYTYVKDLVAGAELVTAIIRRR